VTNDDRDEFAAAEKSAMTSGTGSGSFPIHAVNSVGVAHKNHSAFFPAFFPAFFAAAQRAFAARDSFLLTAALIVRLGFRVLVPEEADRR
jgi:hypothetical protein